MKKIILFVLLAILTIASVIVYLPNNEEQLITKSLYVDNLAIKGVNNSVLLKKPVEIINANIRWINPDTIRTNVVPLLNFTDSNGVYQYSPSGNTVCKSMKLQCLGMEYKTTTIAGPETHNVWVKINRDIDGIKPCDFVNMTEQKSYSYSTIYLPYGVFFYGINRKWDGFGLNTIRGANYYNFTLLSMTPTNVTFKVNTRFEPDANPQTLTINKGSMKIFDQKENTKLYVRGIDMNINVANVTIVQEADTTFRAICGIGPLVLSPKSVSSTGDSNEHYKIFQRDLELEETY